MKKKQKILAAGAAGVAATAILVPLILTGNEPVSAGNNLESHLKMDRKPVEREGGIAKSYAGIVERVSPAVVSVYTTKAIADPYRGLPRNLRYFYGLPDYDPRNAPKQSGVGSGVIISKDGFVLTNHHVAAEVDEIRVYHSGHDKSYEAKLIGSDKSTDVAIIRIVAEREFDPITVGDSDLVRAGDVALAFGSPFGLDSTVSMGIVSAVGRKNVGLVDYGNFIQTDASINRGNSGGALVDADGRLIGINTAIFSASGGNNGIGFAIPVNLAVDVASQLMDGGEVERGYLGILMQDVTPELADYFGREEDRGVVVARVEEGSPADRAGLRSEDLIVAINGEAVRNSETLKVDIGTKRSGTEVKFTVIRDGKERLLTAVLDGANRERLTRLPERWRQGQPSMANRSSTELVEGVTVEDLTPRTRAAFRVDPQTTGVVVTAVEASSPESNRRLRVGDVIFEIERETVASIADTERAKGEADDRGLLVRVRSFDGSVRLLVLK
ncbi:MAG: Do family serine endopeptidase [Verrucomicrobiota bacterium]